MKAIQTATLVFNLLLAGCVQVGPKDLPVADCPKLSVPECPKCPTLSSSVKTSTPLPAIDQTVTIKIRGDQVEADPGGERLLRYYVYARKVLQSP